MNFINKKTTTALLAGFAVLALSGCGSEGTPSATGIIPGVEEPVTPPVVVPPPVVIPPPVVVPPKDMTTAQAKDAMALNALFYPILIPLQSCFADLGQCLIDSLPGTAEVNTAQASVQSTPPAPMTDGTHNCTVGNDLNGKYTVSGAATSMLVVTFASSDINCSDTHNAQDIQGALMSACVGKILGSTVGNVRNTSTYEVQYEGKVTCTQDTSVVFDNYIVSAFGQTTANPNRNSYNMTVSMTNGLGIGGTYQNEKWEIGDTASAPKVNDETWTFTALNLSADTSTGFTFTGNGGASYVGTVRQGDTDNNGMTLSIDFANLAYAVTGTLAETMVNVTGGVKASCQPELVTYSTPAVLKDVNIILDAAYKRMPSDGEMSMVLSGYNPAPAVFSAPGSNAQVDITSSEGTVTYESWRAITTTSSCAGLQEIIDRVIPPVVIPVAGEINPDNVLQDDDNAFVLAGDKLSATGKAAGKFVAYYLAEGDGYLHGQTVAETTFDFSATSVGTDNIFVNVYITSPEGDNVTISIGLDSPNQNTYLTWDDVPAEYDNYTIRTDWFEWFTNPLQLINGNFILRIGGSEYSGTDDFAINKFLLEKK